MKRKLCVPCAETRDETRFSLLPTHLVHPEHGKAGVHDIWGNAICPECHTRWRFDRDNSLEIIT